MTYCLSLFLPEPPDSRSLPEPPEIVSLPDEPARRGFARGAIVLVVSDGWDRGDPELLATEVRRLQLQARRLVWINPRPMAIDQQPLAIGMRAAMPFIDDFVPGHDPRAVAGLAKLIGDLGGQRPVRRLAPVSPAGG